MRERSGAEHIRSFIDFVGRRARHAADVYFVGGGSAVLFGWRPTTIDLDLKISADQDEILRLLPEAKERLQINIELASPADFIPELPGWQDRRQFIEKSGAVFFYHYDFCAQALAKIERGHAHDLDDVAHMRAEKLIEPAQLLELFNQIEPELYRFPAVDPVSFRKDVEAFVNVNESDR